MKVKCQNNRQVYSASYSWNCGFVNKFLSACSHWNSIDLGLDLNGQQSAFQPFIAHEEPGKEIWQSLARLNFDTGGFPVVT